YTRRLPLAEEPLERRALASELRLPALTGTAAAGVLARHAEVLAALVGVEALARATRLTLDVGPGAVGAGEELVPQRRCPHEQVVEMPGERDRVGRIGDGEEPAPRERTAPVTDAAGARAGLQLLHAAGHVGIVLAE